MHSLDGTDSRPDEDLWRTWRRTGMEDGSAQAHTDALVYEQTMRLSGVDSSVYFSFENVGSMAVYGHLTKSDLTTVGNLASMGLIGVFVAIAACYKLLGKRFVFDHHDLARCSHLAGNALAGAE
jgi:hypothetical protein